MSIFHFCPGLAFISRTAPQNRSTGVHSPGVGPHLIVVVEVLRVIMGSATSRKHFDYTDIGYTPEVRVCFNKITIILTLCTS